jgi:signal transduction histidine kinase
MTSTANARVAMVILLLITASSLFFFAYALRLVSLVSTGLTAHKEVEAQLRHSLDDQKRLARLDPRSAADAHRRFDSTVTLLGHLRVLEINREMLMRQLEKLIAGAVALLLACGVTFYLFERRSREQRLVRLESGVAALSRGEGVVTLGERRRDVIGRIAAAVERSSRAAEADRQRLRYLEHLSAWQEAARRHAHEIRTPLTAIRMEVERLTSTLRDSPSDAADIDAARASILHEIAQLSEFTRNFTSFAAIPAPKKRPLDLNRFLAEFASTFSSAWPNLRLNVDYAGGSDTVVEADGEMLRRVLVNLANNSSLAVNGAGGTLTFAIHREPNCVRIHVADNGPGVPPSIRARLFEPYTTSRDIGQGMGLGLAISKKILLDHGGDLDLASSSREGTTFRLTLPVEEP